ncbi:MAG: hypothetical protein CMI63_11200 [Parvularcula sp.]|nr:hypothetical protein [Parvularcula sp.]
MQEFEIIWQKKFKDTPPVGYRLREQFYDRWLRFHSLPKSKRYPSTDEERSVLLSRANTLVGKMFRREEAFWLISSRPDYDESKIPLDPHPFTVESRDLPKAFSWEDLREDPEDRLQWSSYAKLLTWRPGLFDDVFLKIADGEEFAIVFASSDMTSLLAPYDGGFDLILPNVESVSELTNEFRTWLSDRGDGL